MKETPDFCESDQQDSYTLGDQIIRKKLVDLKASTPSLVDMATPVSETLIFAYNYGLPWGSKSKNKQNWLKRFMQAGIDVTFMHTNFGECGLLSFGDIATFKNGQIFLSTHGL